MFEKRAKTEYQMPITALNMPKTGVWSLFNTSKIKVASIDKTKKTDLGGFDLEAAIEKNPDNLFVKVFAIKANEVNDNGDCFSEKELERAASTFVGVPVFVNHQNDNVENARGKVVHSWYDESEKGIYCINMVDRNAYPRLARGIEEGYITGTSMGAQVEHSVCSICHNKAHTADEFCTHIKNGKNRKISGKYACKFHDSPGKPDCDCPVCGTKKGESNSLTHKEAKVYEWNYGIKFIEDSFVVNPACHSCLVCDVLNIDAAREMVASKTEQLRKVAFALKSTVSQMGEGLEKTAGQTELMALTQAMNLMEHVARSMMAQKQQVQLDYVSDLVEQLAKVQSLTDELVEMGYAQLPSPTEHQIALGSMLGTNPLEGQSQQVMNPQQMGQQPQQAMPSAPPQQSGSPASSSLGEIGSITRPTFTGASQELKKDFTKQAENMSSKLQDMNSALHSSIDLLDRRRLEVAKFAHEYANGNLKVTIASEESGEIHVGKWRQDKLVSWASIDEFGDEIKGLMQTNPQEAAKAILDQFNKESGVNMSTNTKVASGNASQQEVTTQKQLDNAGPLHPRENKAPEVILQAQLSGEGTVVNDTTSEDNQQHKNDIRETVTQAQLADFKGSTLLRWDEYPEVITQAQWDEMSRRVSGMLPDDYTSQTTQAQLISLRDNHKWTDPEVVTQKQLDDQKKVSPEGASDSARWASSAKNLVKSASAAIADAIANYNLTPQEIVSAVRFVTASPQAMIKASYLTLLNAIPSKIEARTAERKRRDYFAKSASVADFKPVDGLLASLADNIGYLKAEDYLDAVRFVVADKKAFASAESVAQTKLASRNNVKHVVVDKDEMFRQAFAELDRPEDGLYKICGTLSEDVKIDPANKTEFMNGLMSFAKQHISVPFIIANVNLDKEAGVFEVECKEDRVCSDDEKKAFASAMTSNFKTANEQPKIEKTARSSKREQIIKEAQMMGGQMGGGMGGGGPQGGMGGTMGGADPAAGAGGMPPTENIGGQPPVPGMEEDPMGDSEDLQPKPPGTICPVCGSSDCDVLDGKSKCNNCSAEWNIKVDLEITKYPGMLDKGGEEAGMEGDDEGGAGGEGFALPEGNEPASVPVAAMARITPEMIKKATSDFKEKNATWSLGAISPYTGSTDVTKLSSNKFLCLDTGRTYEVHAAGVSSNGKKSVFAEWRFEAIPLTESCPSCRRKKVAFAGALKAHGLAEDVFDAMQLEEKGKTILAMKAKGLFNNVKTASATPSILSGLKKTAGFGDKFPIETCRAKIARKFGENALAISGPCEGENLADCVCKKLSTAGVYSNSIAIKVASVWAKEDQMVECVEDFVRTGLAMKKACFVCDQIKAKYAQFDDNLAEELGSPASDPMAPTPQDGGAPSHDPMSGGPESHDIDPFAQDGGDPMAADPHGAAPTDPAGEPPSPAPSPMGGGMGGGTISVELPLDVLQQFEGAIDQAKGQAPGAQAPGQSMPGAAPSAHGLDGAGMGGESVIEMPAGASQQLDQVADQALNTAVDVVDGVENVVDDTLGQPSGGEGEDIGGGSSEGGLPGDIGSEGDSAPESGETEVGSDSGNPFGGDEGKDESSEGGDEGSHKEHSNEGHSEENGEEKKESKPDFMNKEGDESEEEHAMAQAQSATRAFKRGKISSTGEINLDLSGVMSVLAKQNKLASEVSVKNVQDDKDIGTISDGSTIGHEQKFDAADPDVFTGDATMGGEKDAGYDNDKPKASFNSGGAEMGHEKEQGYTAEKQHQITDNHRSTAASSSTKSRTAALADRLVANATKTASDKKLENVKPVQEDGDIKPYAANKDNPKSGNPITPQESADIGKIEAGDSSFMGHEKETLTSVPKESNSAPSIPAGGGKNPKYDTKNDAEKQTAHKGTVIARGDAESSAARKEAATRIAGRKLKAGMIEIGSLSSEIEKLSRYEQSDLKDIENALFGASKKGLDTVAKGSEKALVISEKSNQRKNALEELKDSIQGMFTLNKQADSADDNPITEVRRTNNRR